MKEKNCPLVEKILFWYGCRPVKGLVIRIMARHLKSCRFCAQKLRENEELFRKENLFPGICQLESYWDGYVMRILERVGKRGKVTFWQRHPAFHLALGVMLLVVVFYGGTTTYSLWRHRDLLKNMGVIRNLDFIQQLRSDEETVASLVGEIQDSLQEPSSHIVLWLKMKEFRRLPDYQQASILDNYQQWQNFSPAEKAISRKIYHRLKDMGHPAIED